MRPTPETFVGMRLPELVRLLRNNDHDVRHAAALQICWRGRSAELAIPHLLSMLAREDFLGEIPFDVSFAITSFEDLIVPDLLYLLRHGPAPGRRWASEVFQHLRYASPNVRRALSGIAAGDTDPEARVAAAGALACCNGDIELALRTLRESIADTDEYIRVRGVQALRFFCRAKDRVVPVLLDLLDDPNDEIVKWAGYSLTEMRPFSEHDEHKLICRLNDHRCETRKAVHRSLATMECDCLETGVMETANVRQTRLKDCEQ